MKLEGIHHITAITGDAQRNVDFYAGVLGLRLVKKTVNQDATSVYHLFYADELPGPDTTVVYTRETPAAFGRAPGHLTIDDFAARVSPATTGYVCGSSGFAEAASHLLLEANVPAERIRVERFGPTA